MATGGGNLSEDLRSLATAGAGDVDRGAGEVARGAGEVDLVAWTPVESLLRLPAGENAGRCCDGDRLSEGVQDTLLALDKTVPVPVDGAGDGLVSRRCPADEGDRERYVAAAEGACGIPGIDGDDVDVLARVNRDEPVFESWAYHVKCAGEMRDIPWTPRTRLVRGPPRRRP